MSSSWNKVLAGLESDQLAIQQAKSFVSHLVLEKWKEISMFMSHLPFPMWPHFSWERMVKNIRNSFIYEIVRLYAFVVNEIYEFHQEKEWRCVRWEISICFYNLASIAKNRKIKIRMKPQPIKDDSNLTRDSQFTQLFVCFFCVGKNMKSGKVCTF